MKGPPPPTGWTRSEPRLAYTVHGDRGPWVVLVMGLGMRGSAWRLQSEALKRNHRVLTFDHRGLGDSDRLTKSGLSFSIRDLARDVVRIIGELPIDRFHLVGVSMGGMVAQELALAERDRIDSLALIATHGGGPLAWIPTVRGTLGFIHLRLYDDERRLDAVKSMLYPDAYLEATDRRALDERMRTSFGTRPPEAVLQAQLRAVVGHSTLSRLRSLRLGTLVICPGEDQLVRPAACRQVARAIPKAKLVEIPEAGHGALYQCAERVNALLIEHVARHEPPQAAVQSAAAAQGA